MQRFLLNLVLVGIIWLIASASGWCQSYEWRKIDSVWGNDYCGIACVPGGPCLTIAKFGTTVTLIHKSIDGGRTWRVVYSDTAWRPDGQVWRVFPVSLREIALPTPGLCLVACDSGVLLRSTDGGESWNRSRIGHPEYHLVGLSMCSGTSGVVGSIPNDILITSDGGASWTPLVLPDSVIRAGMGINSVAMPAENVIVAHLSAANRRVVIRSEDRGKSWSVFPNWTPGPHMRFIDPMRGWVGNVILDSGSAYKGQDLICRTDDGGRTWDTVYQHRMYPELGIFDVAPRDRMHVIAYGPAGKIISTTDGGDTWSPEPTDLWVQAVPNITGMAYLSDNEAIATVFGGLIIRRVPASASVTSPSAIPAIGLRISPVPAATTLDIAFTLKERSRVSLRIVDMMGRTLSRPIAEDELDAGRHALALDVASLPAGSYVVELTSGGTRVQERMVVER